MKDIVNFFQDYVIFANIAFLIIIIFWEKRKPVYSLFWISLLIFAPYLGFFSFVFFGLSLRKSNLVKRFYSKKIHDKYKDFLDIDEKWHSLIHYLDSSGAGHLSSTNDYRIYTKGEDFFDDVIHDIRHAKKTIYMEYFIFKDDSLGDKIVRELLLQAKNGLEIVIILDGISIMNAKKIKQLMNAGVQVEFFFKSAFTLLQLFNVRVNYRNHRKLTLIDGEISYIGGFNIGTEYIGKGHLGNWRDTALRLSGEITNEFTNEFFNSYNFIMNQRKKTAKNIKEITRKENILTHSTSLVQIVSSGPNFQVPTARDNFLRLIMLAKREILLETPYFVPDEALLDAMKIAALSGVKITIIIPDKPDHFFIYWVNQSFIGELLEYGVRIYKYGNGFIHSKMAVIDGEVATLGTTNFDYRSFYQNFEININIYDKEIVGKLRDIYFLDVNQSKKFTTLDYGKRKWMIKLKESLFRLLSPMM